jgi:hypothetical protein
MLTLVISPLQLRLKSSQEHGCDGGVLQSIVTVTMLLEDRTRDRKAQIPRSELVDDVKLGHLMSKLCHLSIFLPQPERIRVIVGLLVQLVSGYSMREVMSEFSAWLDRSGQAGRSV